MQLFEKFLASSQAKAKMGRFNPMICSSVNRFFKFILLLENGL